MAPHQADAQLGACVGHLLEDAPCGICAGPLGQQQRRHKPARRRAHDGQVVGVDLHQVPAYLVGGERNRVHLGDQVMFAEVDQSGIFPGRWTQGDPGIVDLDLTQQLSKQVQRQLSSLHASLISSSSSSRKSRRLELISNKLTRNLIQSSRPPIHYKKRVDPDLSFRLPASGSCPSAHILLIRLPARAAPLRRLMPSARPKPD